MTSIDCIFCGIYNGREPDTSIYKDENVIILSDIRPAAKHHYLVIPKDHLLSAKHLTKDHIPLVENLIKHGKRILEEKQGDIKDSRFGFHWPPFITIKHLHLHVISPASEMSLLNKILFKDNNLWFVQPEYLLERLAKL